MGSTYISDLDAALRNHRGEVATRKPHFGKRPAITALTTVD